MYQFDLAAEQLSTDLMLSPSSNSPIQMQLEMSLEKRRGISCAVPPSPTTFLAQKAREKLERQSVHEREKRERQCAGISGYSPENVQQELHDSRETIYPLSPRLWNQVDEALGSVWNSGQRHEHGTTPWEGDSPDTGESLGEEIKDTSHNQPHTA